MSETRLDRLRAALQARQPREWNERGIERAAVAIIFAQRGAALELLLIRRAERTGDVWSGHMAFPGGKWSPDDVTLLATAIRETHEEVGIDLGSAELLGQLDDAKPGSQVLPRIGVRPFAFHLRRVAEPTHSPEVAESVWVPLDVLRAPGTFRETVIALPGGPRRFPAYVIGPHVVWGLTERILSPLLGLVFQD